MFVILDRDGVINQDSVGYIKSPQEWEPIPGSLEAIVRLNQANMTVVVATNQSGVGRGYYTLETMHQIHRKMEQQLAALSGHVERIYFCPHTPEAKCACRKPEPGMLHQIQRDFNVDFSDAVFIGDTLKDVQAAQAVNCRPILVKTGKGLAVAQAGVGLDNVRICDDLAGAITFLLD